MRVLELFGGYGSQALALENLGIDFKSDLCEIDKYAIQAYNQLHGETYNYGDICKIDETKLPYYDLITYSSPCQDFSVAGKQAGGDKGSGTRSSLLWECERIIRAVKPKYLLMENVKNLVGKKHIHNFTEWLRTLESMGYQNWWKVLNAKDYGVPQNRERVFVVSILGGGHYQFPEPIKLTKRLKDLLEHTVDEKYYINKTIEALNTDKDGCSRAICRNYSNQTSANVIGVGFGCSGAKEPLCCASRGRNPDTPSDRTTGSPTEQRLEINKTGCSNMLTSVQKDNYVIVPEATKQGYAKAYEGDSINLEQPNSKTRRGRVGHQMANTLTCSCNQGVVEPINEYPDGTSRTIKSQYYKNGSANFTRTDSFGATGVMQIGNIVSTGNFENPQRGRIYSSDGCSPALNTCQGGGLEPKITEQYSIRKLTPRECWRLMGVKDEQFDKLHDISNSQLYKMAGNSIVVDVLMGIFKNLFIETEQKGQMVLI